MIRFVLPLFLLVGCGSKTEDVDPTDDTGERAADDTGEVPEPEDPPLLDGLYSTGFAVGPVAGLVVGLQLDVSMSMDEEGVRTIDTIVMRAANNDGEVSEPMASAEAVPVGLDGSISVNWGPFILPAEFSPTSSMVELDAIMEGTIVSESMLCGDVTGSIASHRSLWTWMAAPLEP